MVTTQRLELWPPFDDSPYVEQMSPVRFEQLYAQEFKPDVDATRKEHFKHTAQNQYPRPAWCERAFE